MVTLLSIQHKLTAPKKLEKMIFIVEASRKQNILPYIGQLLQLVQNNSNSRSADINLTTLNQH